MQDEAICITIPIVQSDGHRFPSVYRVLHTLAKNHTSKAKYLC